MVTKTTAREVRVSTPLFRLLASAAVAVSLGLALLSPVRAADKVVGGSLGGQAPLWPFYIALHKGFFAAQNIDMELNFGQSGAAVVQQLTAGSLDVALSVGITDPVHAIDKGAPIALIRIIGDNPPYALVGKASLKSIADLKGKLISTGQVSDITWFYFQQMMAANGLKPGDYDTLPAGVAAARYAALKAGTVDAAMVLPPVNLYAEQAGFKTLGLAADYVHDFPFTGMAVYRPWAMKHIDLVKRVLAATDASMAWLIDPANREAAVALLVQVAQSKPADAEASYDYLRKIAYFEPSSKLSRTKLQNILNVESQAGRISDKTTVDKLLLPGFPAE